MSSDLLFIDVNIPMYATGRSHPYKPACVWLLREIAAGRLAAAIDTEIVQEVLYRYGALGEWAIATDMAQSLLDLVPTILAVTPADMRLAVDLFSQFGPQGVKARDVIHAAVMQNNGITEIISTDRHFDLLPNVTRIDPQDIFATANS